MLDSSAGKLLLISQFAIVAMANQIQGLKKVAQANRNKTKS